MVAGDIGAAEFFLENQDAGILEDILKELPLAGVALDIMFCATTLLYGSFSSDIASPKWRVSTGW
jgi:hypothetical protein